MIPGFRDGGTKFLALLVLVLVMGLLCGLACSLLFGRRRGISLGLQILAAGGTLLALATGMMFPGAIMRRSPLELMVWITIAAGGATFGFIGGVYAPAVYERLRSILAPGREERAS